MFLVSRIGLISQISRIIGCKGTTKFASVQEKSHFLVFFCSAGYRRALDCQERRKDTQRAR